MTSQPVEANVVLTADNSGYDQAMQQSTQSTNALGTSLDSLGTKMGNLTRRAGKLGLGITAADVTLIGTATAAWASYEKQMSRLASQSAVLTRTQAQQKTAMSDYKDAVKGLRTEYGTTTGEAAKLVETLTKVTNVRQSRGLKDLSNVFVDMSKATGESSTGLASSLTNLQKVMGTPVNAQNTRKYADQFTYLAAQTNTSAQGLVDFTSQLAPIGRSIGMKTEEVAGFAAAFTKAGADGTQVATVFNKVASDISKSISSGSPEMKMYANLIGKSAGEFEKMSGAEQIVQILEKLNSMGPEAATQLERMGLEGPRTLRAITQVINEAGGVRQALAQAQDPRAKGASDEGAKAAHTMTDDLAKLREEMKMTAESFATLLGPAMEFFTDKAVKLMGVIQDIVEGPLGKFAQAMAPVLAVFTGGVGAMLLFAGALLKIAAAFAAVRNSATKGLVEGYKGGSMMVRGPTGELVPAGGGRFGEQGRLLAAGATTTDPRRASTWVQRGLYNTGAMFGGVAGGGRSGITTGTQALRKWWDPEYTPPAGGARGPISYAAGGAGRFMQQFMTPNFDQMRYRNITDRQTWAGQIAPFASLRERVGLTTAMGRTGAASDQLTEVRRAQLEARRDPLLTNEERKVRLAHLEMVKQETIVRRDSALQTEKNMQESISQTKDQVDVLKEANKLQAEQNKDVRGWSRFRQGATGFAGGMGGAVGGGLAAGGRAALRSPMKYPIAGTAAMTALGATGVDSSMLTGASMGMMMGPWGAAAGAAVGAGIDMAKANDKVVKGWENVNSMTKEGSTAFNEMHKAVEDTRKEQTEQFKSYGYNAQGGGGGFMAAMLGNPLSSRNQFGFGATKNYVEGLFGRSDIEEERAQQKAAEARVRASEDTARDLAKRYGGVELEGKTPKQQRALLEQFMDEHGQGMLSAAGVDFESLAGARGMRGGRGGWAQPGVLRGSEASEYAKMMEKIDRPGGQAVEDRLMKLPAGKVMLDSQMAQESMRKQGDVGLMMRATDDIFGKLLKGGMDYLDIIKETEKVQSAIGNENNRQYELQVGVSQRAQQALAMQGTQMGRVGQFRTQVALGEIAESKPREGMTDEDVAQVEQQKQATAQSFVDMDQYFRGLLLAQESYERNRKRQQDAYHLQRSYQEYDYNLQRSRAEEAYERQRRRAIADYYRGVRRAHYDFNLQRKRAEEDFNHSVTVMAKQQALSVMDIYQRVQTQRTASAEWLLSNAGDQLARMQEQAKNLDELRKRGLSDTAIQQLKLTDPANAQQLARFMTELTPQMIAQFNKTAGSARVKAAKDLVTDPSSLEWKEMSRSFRLNMDRGADDFRRQMKISNKDFKRGLDQMQTDFGIMMDDQAEDYRTAMTRQEKAYKLVMHQAAEDMSHMADEISGSLESVLVKSTKKLSGSARTQAEEVLKTFRGLKTSTRPEAMSLMEDLAKIFGFEYTKPKLSSNNAAYGSAAAGAAAGAGGLAQGGVLPGYTPGKDVHHFHSETAGDLHLSGGEGVMVPEWVKAVGGEKAIKAMNQAARRGERSYFLGGVMPLEMGKLTNFHGKNYYGADWAGDLNGPFDTRSPRAKVMAWKSGEVADVEHLTTSYGQHVKINHGGQNTLYAHMTPGTIGVHVGQHLSAGQMIGRVGDSGNAHGIHLHFEIDGGNIAMGDIGGAAAGAAGGTGIDPYSVLKKRYPKSEKAAFNMDGVHPLFPGDISEVINRLAKRKIRKLIARFGDPSAAAGTYGSDIGSQITSGTFGANAHGVWAALRAAGFSKIQAAGIMGNMQSESGFDPFIVQGGGHSMNPAAAGGGGYGLVQWTPGRKLIPYLHGKPPSVRTEINALVEQLSGRGSSPEGAAGAALRSAGSIREATRAFELKYERHAGGPQANRISQAHAIYDKYAANGAIVNGTQQLTVGEGGPEAVIPLNERGAEFMADVMGHAMGGRNVTAGGGSMNVYNTRVDRSTNFTGPITVQASNPQELLQKLQARQRVMALSRPALTGSAA